MNRSKKRDKEEKLKHTTFGMRKKDLITDAKKKPIRIFLQFYVYLF